MANYTSVYSFYHVAKTVEDDPDFDKIKALNKIRYYVESHDKAIRKKAGIMVDHFVAQVAGKQKIGGKRFFSLPVKKDGPATADVALGTVRGSDLAVDDERFHRSHITCGSLSGTPGSSFSRSKKMKT